MEDGRRWNGDGGPHTDFKTDQVMFIPLSGWNMKNMFFNVRDCGLLWWGKYWDIYITCNSKILQFSIHFFFIIDY